MTFKSVHHEHGKSHDLLRTRLRKAGMVLLSCDDAGLMIGNVSDSGDWMASLLLSSGVLHDALAKAAEKWAQQECPRPHEVITGLWLAPSEVLSRRKRSGYTVAVIPTTMFSQGGHFGKMCHLAGMDPEDCRERLREMSPASESDIERLALFVRYLCEDSTQISSDQEAMDNVGQQLAESYEEINLLYTITQSITEVDRPEHFIALACEELLATLPYAWIGAQLIENPDQLKRISQRLIIAGKPEHGADELQELTTDLLKNAIPDTPMIYEPMFNSDQARYAPLGRTVLAYPISRDDKVMGILIAGEKQGLDLSVSSSDIKLVGATASHMSIFLENAALYEDLNTMFLGTLEALTSAIDAKDRYTCGHSQRVAHLTQLLAEAAGLDEYTINRMHIAGLVHDVGKIGVPEAVLTKPGKLTRAEFDEIKKHPEIGHHILKDIPQLKDILPGVLYHHESWDGRGYPQGLRETEIPLVARLITLADSFDAMSSTRTYRSTMSRQEVLDEIRRCSGTQFDPELAPLFLTLDFSRYDLMAAEHKRREELEKGLADRAA